MKYTPLLISVIFYMMIASCQKQNYTGGPSHQQTFVTEAVQFLETQVSEQALATLNTTSPNLVQYQDNPVAVRIYPTGALSSNRFIVLFKKDGRFTGYWVDLSAISKAQADEWEGTVSLLDLKNGLKKRYTIQENKVTAIYDAVEGRDIIFNSPSLSSPDNPQELDAVIVSPHRSYNNQDYFSAYWLFDQDDAYEKEYIPLEEYRQNGGGGGESTTEVEVVVVFAGPDHPIKDIKEELKCFTIDPKAVYSVTVNVNQPVPGTRNLVNLESDHSVGHVYLTIEEQLSNGDMIIRNVGFYPKNSAKPLDETDQSIFGDDSKTSCAVSLKIPISSQEFKEIQKTIYSHQNLNYDLQGFNCTTEAINTFNSVNINLPSTMRHSLKFDGNSPSDLGQDIRQLDLNAFSKENGNRKIIRTLSDGNSILPPARSGNCK